LNKFTKVISYYLLLKLIDKIQTNYTAAELTQEINLVSDHFVVLLLLLLVV